MMPWRTFLARIGVAALAGGAVLTLAVFAGMRLATADPGGPTRDALTYAGVLRMPPSIPTALVFEFSRPGATCSVTTNPVTFDASGAFSVEVPIACPGAGAGGRALFNGDGVTYTVRLGSASGELLTPTPVPIRPVPYARFADQAGINNDCPAGYSCFAPPDCSVCVLRRDGDATYYDEVVKVGSGASAFWIDRYEASVWTSRIAMAGTQIFRTDGDFNMVQYPRNGQWTATAFARSVNHVVPANYITWFQAAEACAASGKTLPTGMQWLLAARGTSDPGAHSGDTRQCRTLNTDPRFLNRPRTTGLGGDCASTWGAQDMIGNMWEWTAEWYASVGQVTSAATFDRTMVTGSRINDVAQPWPTTFGSDATWNISAVVGRSPLAGDDNEVGMPAAALRGGGWISGTATGIFALGLFAGPSSWDATIGFRCVIPR